MIREEPSNSTRKSTQRTEGGQTTLPVSPTRNNNSQARTGRSGCPEMPGRTRTGHHGACHSSPGKSGHPENGGVANRRDCPSTKTPWKPVWHILVKLNFHAPKTPETGLLSLDPRETDSTELSVSQMCPVQGFALDGCRTHCELSTSFQTAPSLGKRFSDLRNPYTGAPSDMDKNARPSTHRSNSFVFVLFCCFGTRD